MTDSKIYAKPNLVNDHRIEVNVLENAQAKILSFEANESVWQDSLINDDFALIALCQYCSSRKKDLYIDGNITRSVLVHIEEFLQIWSVWMPALFSRIKIDAATIVDDIPNRNLPSVLAFSGGVDASFSLAIHKSKQLGYLSKDIGMGILIVGFDLKEDQPEAINNAYSSIKSTLSTQFDIPTVMVKTNWQQEFCPDWLMGFTVGVTAILHLFSSHYACGIISSDFNYLQELKLQPYGSHMVVNHLLGSYTFPIITTGGTHTRLERIKYLKKYPGLVSKLRVCWQSNSNGGNCGMCEKCNRTRMELIENEININIFDKPFDEEKIKNMPIPSYQALIFYEELLKNSNEGSPIHTITKDILDRERGKFNPVYILNEKLQLKDTEIDGLNKLIAQERNMLNAVLKSKSWRITRPLRSISRRMNDLKHLFTSKLADK